MRLQHSYFPVSFAEFLKTFFFLNTTGWMLLTLLTLSKYTKASFPFTFFNIESRIEQES